MAYRLKKSDKTVAHALRRIAREQMDRALCAIDGPGDNPEGIHAARAHCKKLRGLLRLVRPGFSGFEAEDATLREAARHLAALRATGATRETLDRLAAACPKRLDAAALAEIRVTVTSRVLQHSEADRTADIAAFRQALSACRLRVSGWTLDSDGFIPIREGLRTTYASARKRVRKAQDSRTPEDFHDARKSVKYHWYHAQLLRPIRPDRITPRIALAKQLGEILGDHHDLADLRTRLAAAGTSDAAAHVLQGPILLEMMRLEDASCAIAGKLLSDRPDALAPRWHRWWKAW